MKLEKIFLIMVLNLDRDEEEQVHRKPDHKGNKRERIVQSSNGFEVAALGLQFTADQILEDVKNNGLAIKEINLNHQTLELCMVAVKVNGYALKYVKEQTPTLLIYCRLVPSLFSLSLSSM